MRLGIEAPPEVTVLREEVQAPSIAGQLPGPETGGRCRDGMVRGVDHVLRVASDGFEMARPQLESGRGPLTLADVISGVSVHPS